MDKANKVYIFILTILNFAVYSIGTLSNTNSDHYFGLTKNEPMVPLDTNHTDELTFPEPMTNENMCNFVPNLSSRQRQICKKYDGLGKILYMALEMSVKECEFQFKHERWNCSLGQHRLNLIEKGFRETAFLHAITSAALVFNIATGCSSQKLQGCSCGELDKKYDKHNWGSSSELCGDNIKHGVKLTQQFLRKRRSMHTEGDLLNKHNSKAGIKILQNMEVVWCKCYGWATACGLKACVIKLPEFRKISDKIKAKYNTASKVRFNNLDSKNNQSLTSRKPKLVSANQIKPRAEDLVYIENSPNFCSESLYSPGTAGRICGNDCDILCCGRGNTTLQITMQKKCQCKFQWCCEVVCSTCNVTESVHVCN